MTSRTAAKINSGFLVTKDDMASVKTEMAGIKSEFKLMIWMLVPVVAGVLLLVAKAFLWL